MSEIKNENCNLIKEIQFLCQPTCNIRAPAHLFIDLKLKEF